MQLPGPTEVGRVLGASGRRDGQAGQVVGLGEIAGEVGDGVADAADQIPRTPVARGHEFVEAVLAEALAERPHGVEEGRRCRHHHGVFTAAKCNQAQRKDTGQGQW